VRENPFAELLVDADVDSGPAERGELLSDVLEAVEHVGHLVATPVVKKK
jgi:hypothetical protein